MITWGHFIRHTIAEKYGDETICNPKSNWTEEREKEYMTLIGNNDLPPYHATKGAILSMTKTDAICYAKFGIRVNSICPGLIKTDFAKAIWDSPEGERRAKSDIPLGRLGESEDFKGIIVYLASDASSYMTGQNLIVDGGWTAW